VAYDLKDYVTVAERLRIFMDRYPEGSMQLDPVEFRDIEGKTWVIGRAYAYRTPDDPRPGVGTAWEQIPGTTPYTRNSEVQNLETSAWGRALAAIGIGIDKGVATWEEVQRGKAADRPKVVPAGVSGPLAREVAKEPITERQLPMAKRLLSTVGDGSMDVVTRILGQYQPPEVWSKYEASQIISALKDLGDSKSGHIERSSKSPDDWYNVEPPEDTG
jgi:hypothetical protein